MTSWEQVVSRGLRLLRLDSIRSKMLVFGILATLIPSFTTAWISYLQNKRSLTEKITGELQSVSAQTAREMDLWVKERLYELRVFASSYEVSENLDLITRGRGAPALARLTDYLRSVGERFADYPELLVVNPQGQAVATTAPQATPAHLPANWAAAIRTDNAVLGDAYRDGALGKDVVVFAVPIYQTGGRLVGALTAKLDLAAVHHLLRRFAAGASGRVYLITTAGQPLVSSEAEREDLMQRHLDSAFTRRLLEHEELPIELTGFRGDRVLAALEHPFTLLMLDVDRFKEYNDAYGHLAGDAALQRVAAILKESTRDVDCAARYGGEEFVVVLPESEAQGATETAQRIQARLARDALVGGGELGYVTEVFNDMVARLRDSRRELERLSITDDLTGLYNRRYVMEALANEVRRSRRLEHPFTLLMLDVDRFKEYNDAYGHLAGDAALARVAAILKESTRDVDCAARYGGEEFVVLLPETEAEGATESAQRVQEQLARDALLGGKLTVSVGVAQFPADGESPDELLAGADAALYQAKRDGRNRVLRAVR